MKLFPRWRLPRTCLGGFILSFALDSITFHTRTRSLIGTSVPLPFKHTMTAPTCNVLREDWEKHRATILDLYFEKGLPLTRRSDANNNEQCVDWIMKHQHSFTARLVTLRIVTAATGALIKQASPSPTGQKDDVVKLVLDCLLEPITTPYTHELVIEPR